MKVLCLISRGPGHIDFGGMGFLRVIKGLKERGHDVIAFTSKKLGALLEQHQISAKEIKNIDWLWLNADAGIYDDHEDSFFVGLKLIELQIKKEKPQLVLVDSLLGLAANMLRSLDVPFVSFGSPGANWKKVDKVILPGISLHNSNGFKEKLLSATKWHNSDLSAFCNSPFLNVVFLGKEFYGETGENTAYVNLFTETEVIKQKRIGVSLGNGTVDFQKMKLAVLQLLTEVEDDVDIEVYGEDRDVNSLISLLSEDQLKKIKIKYFVDFNKVLPGLTHLIYAGGVGTTWCCAEYNIFPIVVSGNIHDQDFNASRIQNLNWGILWGEGEKMLRSDKKKNPKQNFEFNYDIIQLMNKIEKF